MEKGGGNMSEIDHSKVVLFQDGKLKAFGTITEYNEVDGKFKTNIKVDKGSLLCGEHVMQICREYDVPIDNVGFSAN